MDKTAIEAVLQTYFDSNYALNTDLARTAFHPSAYIYGIGRDGIFNCKTLDAFLEIFSTLQSPASTGQQREDEILSIDFASSYTAVAKVKLRIGEMRYTDLLCLAFTDGQWRIVSKVASGERIS